MDLLYKIALWLNKQSPDKRTHIEAGLVLGASFLVLFALLNCGFPSVVVVAFLAIGLELYDKYRPNGTGFDWQDVRFTIFGGLIPQLLQVIYWVIY